MKAFFDLILEGREKAAMEAQRKRMLEKCFVIRSKLEHIEALVENKVLPLDQRIRTEKILDGIREDLKVWSERYGDA